MTFYYALLERILGELLAKGVRFVDNSCSDVVVSVRAGEVSRREFRPSCPASRDLRKVVLHAVVNKKRLQVPGVSVMIRCRTSMTCQAGACAGLH